jgi:hypothetical protein
LLRKKYLPLVQKPCTVHGTVPIAACSQIEKMGLQQPVCL